jgi:hypothetical protein
MKKIYNMLNKEIYISHSSMLELQKNESVRMSISKDTARNITLHPAAVSHSISLKPIVYAQRLWTAAGFGLLVYSIYASFTGSWWWFILGFIALGVTANANTDANATNILEHAKKDAVFYESISSFLIYELDEDIAEQFKL